MIKLYMPLLCALSLMSNLAFALEEEAEQMPESSGRVKIEWQNPDKYVDVRPSNQSKKRFQESTFTNLEAFLEALAEKLPEGQSLNMTVTNLDLAGHVWPGHMAGINSTQEIRVIKRVDFPRIHFSYQLLDADGSVKQQGEEELKDMSFQDHNIGRIHNDALRYEKNMLESWFKKTVLAANEE